MASTRPLRPVVSTVLAAAGLVAACSDTGLQPFQPDAGAALDDKLEIKAKVCTSKPADVSFPVKILFVVDTSDSMSVTDRAGLRAQAVVQVLNRYAGSPQVQFGVIAFDAQVERLTDGFTNSPDVGMISTRLSMADRLTDYQGALGTAYAMLAEDMQKTSPAERARSKYVVIFFTDGAPDPQCSATMPDPYLVCEVARQDWQTAFNPPLPASLYPALMMGGDYNQPYQIYQNVDDILALQDFYKVGEVRLHAGFLFDPAAAMDPLAAPFNLNRQRGVDLLTQVAMHGKGTFKEFSAADRIDFLSIDYASIKEPNALAQLYVDNTNARVGAKGLVPDSDGDGLPDEDEFKAQSCVASGQSLLVQATATGGMLPASPCTDPLDSDGDGFSDLIEERNRQSGFDPRDPRRPPLSCAQRRDSDGDGLRDCEEAYLGTDPRLFDTDGDRIPDGLEVRAGLDPLDPMDALEDTNRDGMRNVEEVRAHRAPLIRLPREVADRYLYETSDAVETGDGRSCYEITVRDVRLVTTGGGVPNAPIGNNRIDVYFLEAPPARPLDFGQLRVACIDAKYIDGRVKVPASGKVELLDTDFRAPTETRNCVTPPAGGAM